MADVKISLNRAKLRAIQTKFMGDTVIMAGKIAEQARSNAPVLTGNLQTSIRVEEGGKTTILVKAGGSWSWNVPYAKYQEFNHPTKSGYLRNARKTVMSGNWVKKYYGGLA